MNTEQLKTDRTKEEILERSIGNKYAKCIQKPFTDEYFYPTNAIYKAMQDFASQESKKAIDEVLIDKDFIVYCLNQAWNYAHEQLQKKDLGDIEREIYQQQKDKAKALMTKLDS